MIYMIEGNAYRVVRDHKNGWNPEAFRARYSEVLDRYDYIVGDWGYNQLRLKGFFREPNPKAPKDSVISSLADYINEYCNFGCAYFVLEKTDPKSVPDHLIVDLTALPETAESAPDSKEGAAETAASAGSNGTGLLLRWPLKERPIGRVPGTSPSAVARAVSEGAERRAAAQAAAQAALSGGAGTAGAFGFGGAGTAPGSGGRAEGQRKHGQDGGSSPGQARQSQRQGSGDFFGGRGGRAQQSGNARGGSTSSGQDKRAGGAPGGQGGHPKQAHPASAGGEPAKEARERGPKQGSDAAVQGEAGHGPQRSGGRWQGKNRRRGGVNGAKTNRPRGDEAPRAEGGGRRQQEAGGQSGGDRV